MCGTDTNTPSAPQTEAQPNARRQLLLGYMNRTQRQGAPAAPARIGFNERLAQIRAARAGTPSASDRLYGSRFDALKRDQDALAADRLAFDNTRKQETAFVNPDLQGAGA